APGIAISVDRAGPRDDPSPGIKTRGAERGTGAISHRDRGAQPVLMVILDAARGRRAQHRFIETEAMGISSLGGTRPRPIITDDLEAIIEKIRGGCADRLADAPAEIVIDIALWLGPRRRRRSRLIQRVVRQDELGRRVVPLSEVPVEIVCE